MRNKLEEILNMQSEGCKNEQIAKHFEMTKNELRSFMNRQGYKFLNGVFVARNLQEDKNNTENNTTNEPTNNTTAKQQRKINKTNGKPAFTMGDIENIEELYSWYLTVKDNKIFTK